MTDGEFPFVIGGSPSAVIWVPGLGEKEEAGYIGLSEKRFYVQICQGGVPLWRNGERLVDTAWLQPGDRLQVGPTEIVFLTEEDSVVFQVAHPKRVPEPQYASPRSDFGSHKPIAPISMHSGDPGPHTSPALKWFLWAVLIIVFSVLSAAAWFVFTARQVVVRVDPQPEQISLQGGLITPRLGDYYLLKPGKYILRAFKTCFRPLETPITVAGDKSQIFNLTMERLPGVLSLQVHQAEDSSVMVEDAQIHIDDQEVGIAPLRDFDVKPGQHLVRIRAPKYQSYETLMDIEGCGKTQHFDFALVPAWADVSVRSVPDGAKVMLNGDPVGQTPLKLELLPGRHELAVAADGYKTWHEKLVVKTNEPRRLDDIRLQPIDGILALHTNPPGAAVTVAGDYAGKTPLEIPLRPDVVHTVRISKAGYEGVSRRVKISSGALEHLGVDLLPIEGIIFLSVEPEDAEILIDGEPRGAVPEELRLTAVEHSLEIRKESYESYMTKILPRPGFPQQLMVKLKRPVPEEKSAPPVIKTATGYTLNLMRPGSFTMGASRRQQGRRSNETLRKIAFKRPFYLGTREVTNGEFREFLATHDSGSVKRYTLNRDNTPVVQVSWEEAVMFCNWLSAKESLPPAYVQKKNKWVATEPVGTGYRLPTEAEWEYGARFSRTGDPLKYPWGNRFPPTTPSGNFADISAKDLLANFLQDYNDGYAVTAPTGAFDPNALGLYDMGGNVAEWCHDYYAIYPYSDKTVYVDPLGPKDGKHRVVKGSSWRSAGISELRFSFRDYSNGKRTDLGFRVCRYLNDKTGKD